MNGKADSEPGKDAPKGEQSRSAEPSGETEWLKIMLEEIGRKQSELEEEERERLRRERD